MKKIRKILQSIYKKIIHSFFHVLYGRVNGVIATNKDNNIFEEQIIIEKSSYKIYKCNQSTLYTDTIHDTAILKNNKIIKGPSFQFRKNINASCELNSVFINGTPRFRKKLNGRLLSLLVGGAGNSNYWHWLFDVLPKLNIFNKSKEFNKKIDYYLFPSLDKSFQKETLALLGIDKQKSLSSKFFRHLYASEIFATDHPYTFLNKPFVDSLNIPIWISDFLRNSFFDKIKLDYNNQLSKKIFINRKDGHSLRYIINEKDVEFELKQKGFLSLTLSKFNFKEQIQIFNNADIIVGLHGAGFANIVFCKPGTRIIEIRPDDAGDVIKNLAITNKLEYRDFSIKSQTINLKNQTGDLLVDLDLLKKKL